MCVRCKGCVAEYRWRVHARKCFGIKWCKVCNAPFPCTTKRCDWHFPVPPCVPAALVPYFHVSSKGKRNDPEIMKLERKAVRWLREVLR